MAFPPARETALERETAIHPDVDRPLPSPRRVARRPRSATDGLTAGRLHRRPLPADLLAQASRRLEAMALIAAAVWTVSTILYHVVDRAFALGDASWLALKSSDALVGAGVATSLALYFDLRGQQRDPRTTANVGLAFMIVQAFIAGSIYHWDPVPNPTTMPALSWIGIMVLLFAATVPNDPVKMAIAGLIAVSMSPLGMLIARHRGTWPFHSWLTAWAMHYPDFLVVGVSVVVARVVQGMGQQIARAREMGSYELGERIGGGGMGEVYRATHRMLARPAAIKLIRPESMAARTGEQAHVAIERFHREAEAAARLQSPHSVGVYDFGATEDGTLYIVMELLDGMDLESLVRREGPLPAPRVVHILRQVCESLDEAHASGLVHRDIKPANLHIGRFGLRNDFVKVLDFGLVTAATAPGAERQLVTAVGSVPGTPAYMAPEMILGDHVDGRADLYALGCVAYFLLTGQLVFEADNALQSITKRLQEKPVAPSQRTELPVPPDLDALVLACLAAQPSDRPASAGDLARRLAALSVPRWTDEEAARWWAARFPASDRPPSDARFSSGRA
jgi:serine/threonine-protein kinase